jgi:hypothetical protein
LENAILTIASATATGIHRVMPLRKTAPATRDLEGSLINGIAIDRAERKMNEAYSRFSFQKIGANVFLKMI